MSPSVESFNEAKYKTLMDGLECSEVMLSKIDLGDRFDSEYFTKNYLHISEQLAKVPTKLIGKISTTVASAFYPAATQLYSIGDTAFARCVDCVNYPIISKDQDAKFEKIPYAFAAESKGISILKNEDIIITKVGTPCYASIITEYSEIALSRTVLGLTNIHDIDPYYLVIFLRCKYGFEQLFRQRELTIQYQLTLPRVKAINVYDAGESFQKDIRKVCMKFIECAQKAKKAYDEAHSIVSTILDLPEFPQKNISIKMKSSSFSETGRLDAEYYQSKYDDYTRAILSYANGYTYIREKFSSVKTKCDRIAKSYSYIEIGDVSVVDGSVSANLIATENLPDNAKIMTKSGDVLVSTVRPNRGAVAILESDNYLVSGAFTVLRESSDYPKEILRVLLRSDLYKDWLLRYNVGTSYPVIKDDDILNMPIPIMPKQIQTVIVEKVRESINLRNRAKEDLNNAKHAVEIAIEEGEDIALEWLKEKVELLEE